MTMNSKLSILIPLLATVAAHAELKTITFDSTAATNVNTTLSITDQQTLEFKMAYGGPGCGGTPATPWLIWNVQGLQFTNSMYNFPIPMIVAGPATVQLSAPNCPDTHAFATFDIQPAPFPPDKAVTIGAYSGNVKITMEESTDLVNWTQAINGTTYTNSPAARFFRIRMEKNAPPPP
jgi:hypothetical protein